MPFSLVGSLVEMTILHRGNMISTIISWHQNGNDKTEFANNI